MATTAESFDGISALKWFRVCTIGWFLGFLAMVPALVVGGALGEPQSTVPVGMGLGLGYWQSRNLRGVIEGPGRWIWVTVLGLTAPFLAWDVTGALGVVTILSFPVCAAVGDVLVAIGQWWVLRGQVRRAGLWIPVSAIGWFLPVVAIQMGDAEFLPSAAGSAVGLAGMFLGGALIGAATGKPLESLLRERTRATPGAGPSSAEA